MPVNRSSIVLMENSGVNMNKTSIEAKGDSYYGYSDGLHTIQVVYNQFVGRFHVEATLTVAPATDSDWFGISPTTTHGTEFTANNGYVQFNSNLPADLSESYTFKGNFAHIRVRMDRAHVGDGTTYDASYGSISKVILSA
jgi:hypothetical protein|tara:strand:+ start:4864 stop:5283 length:420 start_codon:yes stop_codon:yes gene_type:complete